MTIDKAQLKALAEAAHSDLPDWRPDFGLTDEQKRFSMCASPSTILALLAEIKLLETWRTAFLAERDAQICQRDQLKAELAGLRTGYEAQNQVIAELRKDAERYNWAICRVQCAEALSAVVICHDGYKDKINERVDAYMEAWPCPVAAMAKEASRG
ncbi:hypothetical protein CSV86_014705 [Pseudomonas putida CSV86]|uniref:Uncharacterized protein n=1 Tax=Pseudomonas bharatica CSV86 TaxID=1005395 RepID=L1M4C8_9PSED|nr:hypothetical protein [Pseudomonas bharatica]NNJ16377.1 hypothetical protein [Pseudomonas bharatica CSV86]